MFLPEVTNIRSPTTFAPVVSPTSCLSDPRYSTFGDMTASPTGGTMDCAAAGAASARRASREVRATRGKVIEGFQRAPPTKLAVRQGVVPESELVLAPESACC